MFGVLRTIGEKSHFIAPDARPKLRELKAAHTRIRHDLGMKFEPLSEPEVLIGLQRLESAMGTASGEQLTQVRERIEALLRFVTHALETHSVEEEKFLTPLLSKTLARALKIEHQEIKRIVDDIIMTIGQGWEQPEKTETLPTSWMKVRSLISELNRVIQAHMSVEDDIFELAILALEPADNRR